MRHGRLHSTRDTPSCTSTSRRTTSKPRGRDLARLLSMQCSSDAMGGRRGRTGPSTCRATDDLCPRARVEDVGRPLEDFEFHLDGIEMLAGQRQGTLCFREDRKSTRLNSSHGYISYA